MTVSIIAAIGKNSALGYKNKLPWHLRSDLIRFKNLTIGHIVIIGQNTFESVGGKSLPDRTTLVLSKEKKYQAPGCQVFNSLETALDSCPKNAEVFVAGGGKTYASALPLADRLYLTLVDAAPEADVFFPQINFNDWHLVSQEKVPADDQNDFSSTFSVYEKTKK